MVQGNGDIAHKREDDVIDTHTPRTVGAVVLGKGHQHVKTSRHGRGSCGIYPLLVI